MKLYRIITAALVATLVVGCSAPGKVTYLKDAEKIPQSLLAQQQQPVDPVLGAGDLLNIRVFAADQTAVAPFNKGQYITADGTISSTNSQSNIQGAGAEASTDYYLVDTDGNIDFPLLGKISVAGKTKTQLATEIGEMISPKYVKQIPTVEIRLMNFRVTILGSVNSPGQITSKNERLNILEALAMAGDLDIRGDRENILLYRTNSDGTREIHRLNLHDRNLLISPYFNLQQNDFIYVEPNRSAKQNAWQMHQGWTTAITVVSGISSVASLVIGIINLTD